MALRLLAGVLVLAAAGCAEPSQLAYIEAPAELVRPIRVTGSSRHELWSLVQADGRGDALIAHTQNRGESWRYFPVPGVVGEGAQLVADNNHRVWVAGRSPLGAAALVSVNVETFAPRFDDFSAAFPAGTTDLAIFSGGFDPDPMITARVPDSPDLSVFVLHEFTAVPKWVRHPITDVLGLVGIFDADGGYFLLGRDGGPQLAFCSLPDGTTHCLDVPPWTDEVAGVLPSTPTPQNDWLWRADPGGGRLLRRDGPTFEMHQVEGWPDPALAPVRFFALENGELGVLAKRPGPGTQNTVVWVALDAKLRVDHATELGDCDCELVPETLSMLPDSALVIPSAAGWYVTDLRNL